MDIGYEVINQGYKTNAPLVDKAPLAACVMLTASFLCQMNFKLFPPFCCCIELPQTFQIFPYLLKILIEIVTSLRKF